jgi:hypothetical protein
MAYPSPRRLQLRRGNAAAIASYLGYAGELVVDTSAWTLYVHDGVTVGGYAATVNTASISGNINSILNGTAVFGNIIPSANTVYSLGNITHQWKSLFVSNSTIYVGGVPLSIDTTGNLTVNGNIIPTIAYVNASVANVTVDLSAYALNANVTAANVGLKGYVDQANTIQSSQLTSANLGIIGYIDQANTIQSAQISAANLGIIGYIDQANTIQSAQVGAANLAITAANVGLKGYVDQANTIQSEQLTAANTAWAANASAQQTLIYNLQSSAYSNSNVTAFLVSHTDQTIGGNLTIQGNLTVNGNVTYISVNNLVIGDNIINLADLNPADSLDLGFAAHRTPSGQPMQHTGLVRDASANQWRLFSNVVPAPGTTVDFTNAIYDDLQLGNITSPTIDSLTLANTIQSQQIAAANVGMRGYVDSQSFYSNVKVATYLPTYSGNISANISKAGYTWTFGTNGTTQFPNSLILAPASQSITMQSDQYSQLMWENANLTVAPNMATNSNFYVTQNNATLDIGYRDGSSTQLIKSWLWNADGTLTLPASSGQIGRDGYSNGIDLYNNNGGTGYVRMNYADQSVIWGDAGGAHVQSAGTYTWDFDTTGNLKLPSGGYILNSDDSIYGAGSSYSNVEVATYLQSGNIANVSVAGNVTATYFVGNGAFLTGVVGGAGNYSNVDVKAFLGTDAGFADGYQRVIEGYYANLILGDTTKLFSFGNSSKSYFGHDGFLGNASINYIRADNADVRIATNNGAYAWIFDRNGNLTLSGNTFSVNYANGTPVTFSSSSYSNVQVATYLPTYSGVVTASNVAVAGNVTAQYLFGNGSQLTGIASSYSNVQTAAYLNATGYNLYSNVNVASYLTTATITTTGNITAGNLITGGAFYVANITTTGSSGNISGANYITANVILTNGGWGNISQVANIQANAVLVSGNITATYFLGNGALLTGIVAGSSYSNVQVATYLPTYAGTVSASLVNSSGNILSTGLSVFGNTRIGSLATPGALHTIIGNVDVSGAGTEYFNIGGNIMAIQASFGSINTTGNITAQNLIGNISITGNVTGTSANVTLQAGAYTSVFDNQGNVRLPTAYVTGNVTANYFVGNGALLTGIAASSTYSNVQVATYLPTYSGVVGASNVFVSGNVTAQYFLGNGALLTGIASSYSNVQVATYLPTYTGNIANVRLSSSGALTFPDGTQQTTAAFGGGGNYGNANVAAFLPTYTGTTGITAVGTLATLSVTGNTTVGNLVGTEANTRIIANTYVSTFDIYGNVSFPGNIITPTGLYVGPTLFTALPNTIAQFTGNANSYAQINFENLSSGTDATADYVATANNGTDTTFFVDLGIANSNYDNTSPNNSLGTAVFANDSYLYAQGNLATTTGGNLVIGTSTANKSVKIFAGGINSANIVATVSNTGVAVTGNVSATNFVGSGSLLSGVATKTTGSWTVTAGTNTYSFTIPDQGAYQLWVIGNIPNGIISYNATATITNSNVPVVGAQYAWVYNGGGSPIDFTSIPNQFTGTGNTIVRSSGGPSATTNRFDFGISNTSGGNVTVSYGYVKIS